MPDFVECPLCQEPERPEDMVAGVCLSCADAIAFSQNARRGAIDVGPPRWDVEDFLAYLEKNQRSGAVGIIRDYMKEDAARLRWAEQHKPVDIDANMPSPGYIETGPTEGGPGSE